MYLFILGVLSIGGAAIFFLNSKHVKKENIEKLSDEQLIELHNNNEIAITEGRMKETDHIVLLVEAAIKNRGINL